MKWKHSDSVIAQRMSPHEMKGVFSKKIFIGAEEHAFVERDGKIIEEVENRKCKIGGLFGKGNAEIIIFDTSEKKLQRPVTGLWTKDKKRIDASLILKIKITGFNTFMNHFMQTRNAVLLEDIWYEIREELISRVIGPVVSRVPLEEIVGSEDIQKLIESEAFRNLGNRFKGIGVNLVSLIFTPAFSYENEKDIEKTGGETQETKSSKYDLVSEKMKKMEETASGKFDKEATMAEMENERIRRETEMQLEREETQTDIEEALEALELKDIKNKEKLVKEIKKLKTEIKPDAKDTESAIKNLENDIEKLRMERELAEKKFYKNEITEENFKKLADNYEKKIIELQTKIESLKKG